MKAQRPLSEIEHICLSPFIEEYREVRAEYRKAQQRLSLAMKAVGAVGAMDVDRMLIHYETEEAEDAV